jgi:uncharacterized membrane protein
MALSIRPAAHPSARSRQNLALIVPLLALLVYRLVTRGFPAPGSISAALSFCGTLLLVGGLYGYLRHPLYVGSFLLGLGLSLIVGDWVVILAFLALFVMSHGTVLKIEEQELSFSYGEAYDRYCAAVPPFIPRLPIQPRRVMPSKLREAFVRECDAVCLWLALPLVLEAAVWGVGHPGTPGVRVFTLLMLTGVVCLAMLWVRWKQEYRTLIRRERRLCRSYPATTAPERIGG